MGFATGAITAPMAATPTQRKTNAAKPFNVRLDRTKRLGGKLVIAQQTDNKAPQAALLAMFMALDECQALSQEYWEVERHSTHGLYFVMLFVRANCWRLNWDCSEVNWSCKLFTCASARALFVFAKFSLSWTKSVGTAMKAFAMSNGRETHARTWPGESNENPVTVPWSSVMLVVLVTIRDRFGTTDNSISGSGSNISMS